MRGKLRHILDAARRLHRETVGARLPLVSASVAFYCFFAIFPMLVAIVSIYGLVASSEEVQRGVKQLAAAMPADAKAVVTDTFTEVAERSGTELSVSLVLGVGVAIFSAAKAMFALIWGLNLAYGETETRPYVVQRLLAIALTGGAVAFAGCALALIAVLPLVLPWLGLEAVQEQLFATGRWPLLGFAHATGLSVLYHYAPNRTRGRYRWFSWGALSAAGLWLAASWAMSLYAEHLPESNEIYGALGGVIALNAWTYVSIVTVLLGAKLNAEIESRAAPRA